MIFRKRCGKQENIPKIMG